MNNYRGITYFKFLDNEYIHRIWKKLFCPKNIHLLDEVGGNDHYLSCDACDLEVHIKEIKEYEVQ